MAKSSDAIEIEVDSLAIHGSYAQRSENFFGHVRQDFSTIEEKTWLIEIPHPRSRKTIKIAQWTGFALGFVLIGLVAFMGINGLTQHTFCLVFEDDFADLTNWSHDVELGGFGHGMFDWTTSSSDNSFLKDGQLHIVPTLTDISQTAGASVNLTQDGTCTSQTATDCVATYNSTLYTVINPVQSARLNTLDANKTIKYGKVEVTAKFPKGDWLRPIIQLLPVEQYYGPWLYSGELVMAQAKGNDISYPDCGLRCIQSRLALGVESTEQHRDLFRTDLSQEYHTYGLIWTPQYILTYLDSPQNVVFYQEFIDYSLWIWLNRKWQGNLEDELLPLQPNMWSSGATTAPFDRDFYLSIGLQVGGVDGFFPDGVADKPWVDAAGRDAAMNEFYLNTQKWNSSWADTESRTMSIKSVKMWKMCS